MNDKINEALLEVATKAQIIGMQQTVGENNDYYITIEQLHNIIKDIQEKLVSISYR